MGGWKFYENEGCFNRNVNFSAVSYTHLDVYKRQTYKTRKWLAFFKINKFFNIPSD